MRRRCASLLFILVLSLSLAYSDAKVFTRCQLTRELLKNNFPRTFLSNWVCLIEQESERNTAALVVKSPRRKYYGLFQIGSEWCKEGRKGGKCDITCESLVDDDIKDDAVCALKVFELEGFKYWTRWEARCKGHTLPDIEKLSWDSHCRISKSKFDVRVGTVQVLVPRGPVQRTDAIGYRKMS